MTKGPLGSSTRRRRTLTSRRLTGGRGSKTIAGRAWSRNRCSGQSPGHRLSGLHADYTASLLRKNNNNISHAARESEIDRKYFRKLMKNYGLHVPTAGDADDDEE